MSSSSESLTLSSGEKLPYTVDQRDVENSRITLNPDGTLSVVVPPGTPESTLISQEQEWIEGEYQKQQAELSVVRQEYGLLERGLTLWGKTYTVIKQVGQYDLTINNGIHVTTPESASTEQYLYNQIRNALFVAVETIASDYCDRINADYANVTIRSQRTKWASCSSGDTLNFNLRCAFLPLTHLRYLVAHEVAHLCESNHSEAFWELVTSLMPEYQSFRNELQGFWYAVHHNDWWKRLLT